MDNKKHTRIDPELARQLEHAGAEDLVRVVVYLRTSSENPKKIEQIARDLIAGVSAQTGVAPHAVNVMRYLGTVALEASVLFIRALLEDPAIASAVANTQPRDDSGQGSPNAKRASARRPVDDYDEEDDAKERDEDKDSSSDEDDQDDDDDDEDLEKDA